MMNFNIQPILIPVICGWLSCVLCSIIFFGVRTLEIDNPLFIFVKAGCLGSVAFALFIQNRIRDAVFLLILLSIFEVVLFGLKHPVTHLLFIIALIMLLYFFARRVYKKLSFYKIVRPRIIAGKMAISFICITVIVHLLYAPAWERLFLFENMPIGFMIGISLGIGFELAQNFSYR